VTGGKFDDVPTEPLFDSEPFREGKSGKQRTIKSVAQGKCPLCTRPKVGLVQSGTHIAWRQHTYKTWGGVSLDCMATGIYACVLPETNPLNPSSPVSCPHNRAAL
jgi:hypothetical protein